VSKVPTVEVTLYAEARADFDKAVRLAEASFNGARVSCVDSVTVAASAPSPEGCRYTFVPAAAFREATP